ncbi:MAG: LptA/OstA family protein, partial [bacterium]
GRSRRAVEVEAAQLLYSQPRRLAQYSGGVTLNVSGATLRAPKLTLYFSSPGDPGATPVLPCAQASGGVAVTQATRRAQAKTLSIDFANSLVTLQGGPPRIFDAEHGKISGDPLTFSLASDEIQVGGKHGTRVFGQTHGNNR